MDSDILNLSFGPELQKDSMNSDKSLALRGCCSLNDGSLMSPPCQNRPTELSGLDAGQCLIDPPRHQPTLSLDLPPEAEDGGSQPEPEISSTSGLDDSCQLETISSEVKIMFGKMIHSLDPESIYGSTSSGLSGNLRKASNLRVDSLTESNENTGTSESEDYLNDNERSSTSASSFENYCSLDVRSITESGKISSEFFAGIKKYEQMMVPDSNSPWQIGLDSSSVENVKCCNQGFPILY